MVRLPGRIQFEQAYFEESTRCLEEAKKSGEVGDDADSEKLATAFWIGWEGSVLRAKLDRSPAALDLIADFFFTALRK